jgi:hypothetical protein
VQPMETSSCHIEQNAGRVRIVLTAFPETFAWLSASQLPHLGMTLVPSAEGSDCKEKHL